MLHLIGNGTKEDCNSSIRPAHSPGHNMSLAFNSDKAGSISCQVFRALYLIELADHISHYFQRKQKLRWETVPFPLKFF